MTKIERMLNILLSIGGSENYDKAFELASNGEQSGCNNSKALLAICYYYGCGCKKNVDEALRLAKESADQGNKYGHLILGRILYWKSGLSCRHDAIKHYMIAAEMELAEGLVTIGSMYIDGTSLPMDKKIGLEIMMKAADQEYAPAYEQLGRCYEIGDGVPVNKSEARKWYQMAVDAGFTLSQKGLNRLGDS